MFSNCCGKNNSLNNSSRDINERQSIKNNQLNQPITQMKPHSNYFSQSQKSQNKQIDCSNNQNQDIKNLGVSDTDNNDNVSHIFSIDKQIDTYDNNAMRDNLRLLQKKFTSYIESRGDGNCFYRAFIVSLLIHLEAKEVEEIIINKIIANIPAIKDEIKKVLEYSLEKITDIRKHTFRGIYKHNEGIDANVNLIINTFLTTLTNINVSKNSIVDKTICGNTISDIFKKEEYFDFSAIVLMRAIAIVQLDIAFATDTDYQEYLLFREELNCWGRKYSEEAQLHLLPSLANFFEVKLMVHQVSKSGYAMMPNSKQENNKYNMDLFFRPGHYDIVTNLLPTPEDSQKLQGVKIQSLHPNKSAKGKCNIF